MKGLIITLTDNCNYGNRLQNYALQEILKRQGLEIESYNNIYIDEKTIKIKRKIAPINIRRVIKSTKSRLFINKKSIKSEKREEKIKEFTDKYIKTIYLNKDTFNDKYDYIILGSDQVWNPNFIKSFDINLGMAFNGEKVFSYAASFGTEKIAIPIQNMYMESLKKMKEISVRENRGREIVKELCGRDATVLLDPTLMIKASKWKSLEKRPDSYQDEKYILIYCVGNTFKKKEKTIKKISKNKNLKIINLTNKKQKEYISGVEEFLYYIDNADMIITDSFHACVFSILFKKNFWFIERNKQSKGMNDRIYTLLNTFEIEDRKFDINCISNNINYSKTDEILEQERKKSMQFLTNALDIENDKY